LQAACNPLRLSKKKEGPRGKASLSRHRAGRGDGGEVEEAENEESGKKEGDSREKEGTGINCPLCAGNCVLIPAFREKRQEGKKGAWLPAGGARIHAVHDPHAFYMVTTWRRIASRCVKEAVTKPKRGKGPAYQRPGTIQSNFYCGDSIQKRKILRWKQPSRE